MNIQEELRISGYQPVVGFLKTDVSEIFDYWERKHGYKNAHFLCSLAYNLGKVHGKREERARRKKRHEGGKRI